MQLLSSVNSETEKKPPSDGKEASYSKCERRTSKNHFSLWYQHSTQYWCQLFCELPFGNHADKFGLLTRCYASAVVAYCLHCSRIMLSVDLYRSLLLFMSTKLSATISRFLFFFSISDQAALGAGSNRQWTSRHMGAQEYSMALARE